MAFAVSISSNRFSLTCGSTMVSRWLGSDATRLGRSTTEQHSGTHTTPARHRRRHWVSGHCRLHGQTPGLAAPGGNPRPVRLRRGEIAGPLRRNAALRSEPTQQRTGHESSGAGGTSTLFSQVLELELNGLTTAGRPPNTPAIKRLHAWTSTPGRFLTVTSEDEATEGYGQDPHDQAKNLTVLSSHAVRRERA